MPKGTKKGPMTTVDRGRIRGDAMGVQGKAYQSGWTGKGSPVEDVPSTAARWGHQNADNKTGGTRPRKTGGSPVTTSVNPLQKRKK